MVYSNVSQAVVKTIKRHGAHDPFRLAEAMGIVILYENFGCDENAIKGFATEMNRIKMITLNADLLEIIQRIILAHEIGHIVLHRRRGIREFHEFSLFDESSLFEKEANLFAAEYLLSDEDVLEAMNGDTTFFSAAAMLHVPAELLDFKFRVMKWKGYQLVEAPIMAKSNFMKDMEIPADADYCE